MHCDLSQILETISIDVGALRICMNKNTHFISFIELGLITNIEYCRNCLFVLIYSNALYENIENIHILYLACKVVDPCQSLHNDVYFTSERELIF